MAKKRKIKIMVASTVYQNRDLLLQICGILNTYGYHVVNSEYGTLHPPLGMNNTDACIAAVAECDIFFGIINPMYSTGITHLEFQRAIAIDKPRRFIAHSFVTFSRKLLAQYMYADALKTQRNNFEIQPTSVMDDVKVIDMYNDAVQINLAYEERKYHWVQEFFRPDEALRHVETLFRDIKRVELELANLNNPIQ
ncbi:DUF4062 domain-containing protein [Flavobacterium tructae]|uniref:DUF4062 domain-containing protein n=1 Tax=Flavobacterium tructae TaxID=1114873 RepID=UPI0035A883A6